jgi:integrase/recombinase XerD
METLEKYRVWLLANGMRPRTVDNHICNIRAFLKEVDINNITEDKINAFIVKKGETVSVGGLNQYKASIRSFLTHLKLDIPVPKGEKTARKLPKYITEEFFVKEIIPYVDWIFPDNPLKIKALLYFMFYTGLRREEIVGLKREHIDLEQSRVKVFMPKVKLERYIPFLKVVRDLLEVYFQTEPEMTNAFNISYNQIRNVFKKIRKELPNLKDFTPHLFRHSFATHCKNKGLAIDDVQYLMGHSNINTTLRYAHTDITEIQKRYNEKLRR